MLKSNALGLRSPTGDREYAKFSGSLPPVESEAGVNGAAGDHLAER